MDLNTSAYQSALDYLYSFVDYSLTRNFRYSPEKFNLGRMVAFLDLLGNPHKKYPVIHVAGTKGKGSTSVFIASSLQEEGYRVGLYTSPHLLEFTERIMLNGKKILPEELVELVEYVKPYVSQIEQLTTFEITSAVGFLYFSRQNVDVAVIEVGLGGRLDATNTVDPLVSVITSLSLDHVAVLGDTLEKIAYEKAGILKPGRPVVMAPQAEEARRVVESIAEERGCALVQVGRDYKFQGIDHSLDRQVLQIWQASNPLEKMDLSISLLGNHQVENAATAFVALKVALQQGLSISDESIQRGFAKARWPGRFEVLHRDPTVIVDSAHNRDSARRLHQAVEEYLPGRPVILIFGASEDKDVEGMFAELLPGVSQAYFTQSLHPRAMSPSRLAELAVPFNINFAHVAPVEEALAAALESAGNNGVILVAGSLFIAAAVLDIWQKTYIHKPVAFDPVRKIE